MSWVKKVLIGVGGLLVVAALGLGGFVYFHTSAYDASLEKVYEVPLTQLALSADEAVLLRGKHLANSVAPCAASDCHGKDLSGGKVSPIGPIGTLAAPNITKGGIGAAYSDAELGRLIIHGIKKDGRGVRFMSSHEFNWIPESDLVAIVSYVRSLPPVSKATESTQIGALGKVLDRLDVLPIDVARRVNHANIEKAPPPTPTAAYGRYIARLCTGCHGDGLSGGPIPGVPPDIAVPLNLTPHATGTGGWSYDEFKKVMTTGVRRDGRKLDPMMPVESFGQFDDVEMHALYAYLQGLPPQAFGGR